MHIGIRSEFGELRRAIVHSGENCEDIIGAHDSLDEEFMSLHPEGGEVLAEELQKEAEVLHSFLEECGVSLEHSTTQDGQFCQVFARDPSFVVHDTLFIGAMEADYRQGEPEGILSIREKVEDVVDLRENRDLIIEGGDVMLLDQGNVVLVGTGQISNKAGFLKLARELKQRGGPEVVRVPHTALHLDCCFAPLPNGDALFSQQHLPQQSINLLQHYTYAMDPLDEHESSMQLAANLSWINPEQVVSTTHVHKTNQYLSQKQYDVKRLMCTNLIHLLGGVRCAVCPLLRKE